MLMGQDPNLIYKVFIFTSGLKKVNEVKQKPVGHVNFSFLLT